MILSTILIELLSFLLSEMVQDECLKAVWKQGEKLDMQTRAIPLAIFITFW